jgi:di/tricarboxylate transporter
MKRRHWPFLVLACAGAGLGAVIAKSLGVTSWLDAKLYIVASSAAAVLLLHLVYAFQDNRHRK